MNKKQMDRKHMDKKRVDKKQLDNHKQSKSLRHGAYSVAITVIVIIAVLMVDAIVSQIPSQYREIDCSQTKLYTISDTTKQLVKNLNQKVTLYYICEGGKEKDVIQKLLERYEDVSSQVKVEQKDPVIYPNFVSQYTEDQVADNSVIAVCGDRSKIVSYSDMYEKELDYTTMSYKSTAFDGEGMVTSAIDYVTSDNLPKLYVLNGNGEKGLTDQFTKAITKNNIELQDLNLLSEGTVPGDAAAVFMNAPAKDYSKEEAQALITYFEAGGKGIIFSDFTTEELPNFQSVLADYGVSTTDGVVLEGKSTFYANQKQYNVLPTVDATDFTDKMIRNHTFVLAPTCQGVTLSDSYRSSITVTAVLTTSESSYEKKDVQNIKTMEKEAGDAEGPFDIGVLITEDINTDTVDDTAIMYFTTSYLLDDETDAYVSGGNAELVATAVNYLCTDKEESTAVPSKSLQIQYLTLSDFAANLWAVLSIFIIPIGFVAAGFTIWYRRRKR